MIYGDNKRISLFSITIILYVIGFSYLLAAAGWIKWIILQWCRHWSGGWVEVGRPVVFWLISRSTSHTASQRVSHHSFRLINGNEFAHFSAMKENGDLDFIICNLFQCLIGYGIFRLGHHFKWDAFDQDTATGNSLTISIRMSNLLIDTRSRTIVDAIRFNRNQCRAIRERIFNFHSNYLHI